MPKPPRFDRRWREQKIEALERQLGELHRDRSRRWERCATIHYEINRHQKYLRMHPGVVLHVGHTQTEILRKSGWESYIHPLDMPRSILAWRDYLLSGRPIEGFEFRYRHASSGRYVFLEESGFPVDWGRQERPTRFACWFKNVTDRKCAEIEFLLWCLDESGRPTALEARREIVHRADLEAREPRANLHLINRRPR